jgi:hypothetical protein
VLVTSVGIYDSPRLRPLCVIQNWRRFHEAEARKLSIRLRQVDQNYWTFIQIFYYLNSDMHARSVCLPEILRPHYGDAETHRWSCQRSTLSKSKSIRGSQPITFPYLSDKHSRECSVVGMSPITSDLSTFWPTKAFES